MVGMPQLKVTIKRQSRVCVLSVSGELDIATTAALAELAVPAVQVPAELVVIDLTGLEFIDCRGAQALAAVSRAVPPGCPVLVRGVGARVRKVLDILAISLERGGEEDQNQAVAWLVLESQVLRSWSEQVRAAARHLVARSRQERLRRADIPEWSALPAALGEQRAGQGAGPLRGH